MDVLFFSPAFPVEMVQFTRGLAEVGARIHGVGDQPLESLPAPVRQHLSSYLQVPRILEEEDVLARVEAWLGGRRPDRIESAWELDEERGRADDYRSFAIRSWKGRTKRLVAPREIERAA